MTSGVDFSRLDDRSPDWFISRRDAELLQEVRAHVYQWRTFAEDDLDAALIEMFAAALAHLYQTRKFGGHYVMQVIGQTSENMEGTLYFELTPQHVLMRRIEWPIHCEEPEYRPWDDSWKMMLDTDGSYDVAAAKEFFHFSLALMKGPVPPRVLTKPVFLEKMAAIS